MFSAHVALVPYRERLVPHEELLHVASALQTQVIRDLGPYWDVSGAVSPFLGLEDVPPFCVPLVIVEDLPKPSHSFHELANGRPIAIVGYQKGWPLLASHELLEMLCDPWGARSLAGRSLKAGQGEVEYLVEVCDPCQYEHYMVGGIPVSDFVTPAYYRYEDPLQHRYSFTGAVKRPLHVPAGGILTWRTASGAIWQKSGSSQPRPLRNAQLSRAWRNSHPADKRTDITDKLPQQRRSAKGYYRLETRSQEYGAGLKAGIDQILEQLGVKAPNANLAAILDLLRELADPDSAIRALYQDDAEGALSRFGLGKPETLAPLADPAYYRGVLAAIDGGLGVGDPKLAEWLSTHSSFVPAGIW